MIDSGTTVPYWLQILGTLGSFLSGVGLIATAVGVFYVARQTRANERATTAAVYQSIISSGFVAGDTFINHPELHNELFDEKGEQSTESISTDDLEFENPRLFFIALKWLDYFETVLVLWDAIPPGLQKTWSNYIVDTLSRSSIMRKVVIDNEWYGGGLREYCLKAEELYRQRVPAAAG